MRSAIFSVMEEGGARVKYSWRFARRKWYELVHSMEDGQNSSPTDDRQKRGILPEEEIMVFNRPVAWTRTVPRNHHSACPRDAKNTICVTQAQLYPLIGRASRLNLKHKMTVISTVILKILTYASTVGEIWPGFKGRRTCISEPPWYVTNRTIFNDNHTVVTTEMNSRTRYVRRFWLYI